MQYNTELSYAELCAQLGLTPQTGGKQKKLQLIQINKLYEVEKVKNKRGKYIIHRELSSEEKTFADGLSDYSNYLYNVLLNYFAQDSQPKSIYTFRELREGINMINDKYYPVKYGREQLEDLKIPSYYSGDIDKTEQEWINITDDMDEHLIKYNLQKMQKNGLIEYYYSYVFYYIPFKGSNKKFRKHYLNDKELADFLELQNITLKNLGLENKQDLFKPSFAKQRKEYFRILQEYIEDLGYTRYGRTIVVIKPKGLNKLTEYFSLTFNQLKVKKCLESRRYKTIPPFIHSTLVEQLIKI